MTKYIDADKEEKDLREELEGYIKAGFSDDYLEGFEEAIYPVKIAPAADVAEVRHGRWILHDDGDGTCDQCRVRQKAIWDDDNAQNFCGHCGAKMDKEGV